MLIEVLALGLVTQIIVKGQVDIEVKHIGFIFFQIFCLLALCLFPGGEDLQLLGRVYIQGVFVLLLGFTILVQKPRIGCIFLGLGLILNGLMLTKYGRMPVDPNALIKAGQESVLNLLLKDSSSSHILMSKGAAAYLGDWISLPPGYPLARVISIGDICMSLGLFILLVFSPLRKELRHE